ncbi:MAG: glycosyltransferase [Armatimonadetes bacterium]|nr:glycosyltransferase [Armatimonadota bacterium]
MPNAVSLSIVLEWENAKSMDRQLAIEFLVDLAQRIDEVDLPLQRPVELMIVYDEDVNESDLRGDVAKIHDRLSQGVHVSFLFAPGTGYYEKKGLAPYFLDSEIIAYADSDCTYSEGWLSKMTLPIHEGRADMVFGNTQVRAGDNLVERACELAWFFPTDDPSDPLKSKSDNRFFANNFAVRRQTILDVPIPRFDASRSQGRLWLSELSRSKKVILKEADAVATHKQYGTIAEFLGRAWLLGKDKDAGNSVLSASRFYRLRRSFAAVFELNGKFIGRFVSVGLRRIPFLEVLPAFILGVVFQLTANTSQLLASLRRRSAEPSRDYTDLIGLARAYSE